MSDVAEAELESSLSTHAALVLLADRWLRRQGCGVVSRDAFRAITDHGEQPDAIGWRGSGVSIRVECKATRNDFLADRRKPFRLDSGKGLGDWRFYLCPKGLITKEEVLPGWGLLYANGKRVEVVCGMPGNTGWLNQKPFVGAKSSEVQMLYSALRRMEVRGFLDAIYQPLGALTDAEAIAYGQR